MEKYLNKISFTMLTFVSILMLFFTAGATYSTTQVALAKTNISIHVLKDVFVLIGFEFQKHGFKNGLGGLRSLDLQLRRLPRYPYCATSPAKKTHITI